MVYLSADSEKQRELLRKLGKHRMTKSCLYFRQLSDIDKPTLEKLVVGSIAELKQRFPKKGSA